MAERTELEKEADASGIKGPILIPGWSTAIRVVELPVYDPESGSPTGKVLRWNESEQRWNEEPSH